MAYKRRRSSSRPGSAKRTRTRRYRKRGGGRRRRYRKRSGANKAALEAHTLYSKPASVNLRSMGFPTSMIVHLPWRNTSNLTTGAQGNAIPGSGTEATIQFRLNSPTNIIPTDSGKQPRYFDQLVTQNLYNQYTVYKVDVSVTARNRSTNDLQIFAHVRPDSTIPSTDKDVIYRNAELPMNMTRQLSGYEEGGDHAVTTFNFTIYPHKVFGITKAKLYSDKDFSGTFATTALEVPFLTLGVSDNPSGNTSGLECQFDYTMVFHMKLYDLAQSIPQSSS